MFARDSFARQQLDLLAALGLSDEVADKIFHGNAERLTADAGKGI